MKTKLKIKLAIDALMTLTLLFLMGYQFWGETAHEWAGAGLFALLIAHHVLNLGWYRLLFRGRYTPMCILQLCINMLTLAAMLALMYSSVFISGHVFRFLQLSGGMALARRLHILGAYWGLVLMSLHLGLHWNMLLSMLRRKRPPAEPARARVLFALGLVIAAYGAYVFISRDFPTYMLLRREFVFLDYSESPLLYYLDHLSLMGLFVFLSHYLSKWLRKTQGKSRKGQTP